MSPRSRSAPSTHTHNPCIEGEGVVLLSAPESNSPTHTTHFSPLSLPTSDAPWRARNPPAAALTHPPPPAEERERERRHRPGHPSYSRRAGSNSALPVPGLGKTARHERGSGRLNNGMGWDGGEGRGGGSPSSPTQPFISSHETNCFSFSTLSSSPSSSSLLFSPDNTAAGLQ